jgi:hypothetical protein
VRPLVRLIQRERQARQNPSSGEILLLVGEQEYQDAVASGRLARASDVIRIELVDPLVRADDRGPTGSLLPISQIPEPKS